MKPPNSGYGYKHTWPRYWQKRQEVHPPEKTSSTEDENVSDARIHDVPTKFIFEMAARKVDASLRLVKNQRAVEKKIESPLAKYPFLKLGFSVWLRCRFNFRVPFAEVFFILQPARICCLDDSIELGLVFSK